MGVFSFSVEVSVYGWTDPEDGRTEQDYAEAALNAASLSKARSLDGFADLAADAGITGTWRED
jgi:hypothetical protein